MFRIVWSAVTAAALATSIQLSASSAAAAQFGFSGPEIFPIDFALTFLKTADLDGDGLNDLIVVNNLRSKINLLYNRTGNTNAPSTPAKVGRKDINELPSDARFRVESVSSEKRISSLCIEDLNGDHRPDLIYYGEPKELVVQFNQGTNGWSLPKRYDINDGLFDANALITGDINGDGRPDVLLLAEKHIHILLQTAGGTLGEPEKLPYSGVVKALQVLDLDGDGRHDLLLVNWDNANPFRFRLQTGAGRLGPEIHLSMSPVRSYWADDLDGDSRTEIITIAAKSGRAAVANFVRKPATSLTGELLDGQFHVQPLPRTDKSRRGVVWADVTGDGLPDLLVTDPDAGQLTVHAQGSDGALQTARTFPTLGGVVDLVAADWNHDGSPELFLLSGDEKQIGVASVEPGGRLGFPKPMLLSGRPLAMSVGNLNGNIVVAAITEREEKRTNAVDKKVENVSVRELALASSGGKIEMQGLAENFKGAPASISFHDADQDGRMDIVVLTPYEKIKVLRQLAVPVDGRQFEELDVNPPGGTTDAPWSATADVDGDGKPELLLAQKNFLRAVVLRPDSNAEKDKAVFEVKDQINGASSSSRIVAATTLPLPGSKTPALFLLDGDRKGLTVCTRDTNGVWKAGRNVTLPVSDFASLVPVEFGRSGGKSTGIANTVAMLGQNSVAWKRCEGDVWEVVELDGYETPIRDGFLHDIVSGDLNGDKRKDLVFLETGKAYVDLVTFEPPHQLVPANRWQVFEERTFRQRRGTEVAEPREALVADLTGDGKSDLVILVHDRLLLYPQE